MNDTHIPTEYRPSLFKKANLVSKPLTFPSLSPWRPQVVSKYRETSLFAWNGSWVLWKRTQLSIVRIWKNQTLENHGKTQTLHIQSNKWVCLHRHTCRALQHLAGSPSLIVYNQKLQPFEVKKTHEDSTNERRFTKKSCPKFGRKCSV